MSHVPDPAPNRVPTLEALVRRSGRSRSSEIEGDALVTSLPGVAAFVVDHDLRYVVAEGEALAGAGLSPADLVGRTVGEAFGPAVEAEYAADYRRALAGQAFAREHEAHGHVYFTRGGPLRDASGRIYAALAVSTDVTERRLATDTARAAAARQAFLLQLDDALRPLADPAQIQCEAARILGEYLGVHRAFYTEIAGTGSDTAYVFVGHYAREVAPLPPGRYPVAAFGDGVIGPLRAGHTISIEDTEEDSRFDAAARAAYRGASIRAHAAVPLLKDGRLVALFGVHAAAPRAWPADELRLIGETAERTWSAVERARAEAGLRASEARFRTVQDASPLGFAIHRPVREGGRPDGAVIDFTIPYVNAAGAQIVGHPREALLAGTMLGSWPGTEPEGVFADYVRVLETGEPGYREILYEHDELVAGLTLTVVRIGEGADAEIGITFTDVTARLRAERERDRLLAETEAARAAADLERRRLETVLQQLPVGVHVAEAPSGRLVLDNAAVRAICGEAPCSEGVADYSADYAGHYPPEHPRAGEPLASDAWPLARALATGAPVGEELVEIRRADGMRRLAGISAAPVCDADGRVVGAVATSVDVTERERLLAEAEGARRAAEAANRAKSEFLATMSHELRTPLNAIGGYAELIELGIHGPVTSEQRTALERIQRSQRHLLGLIAGVLDYSRVEAGAVTYRLVDVPVAEAVAEAEVLVAPQLRAKGLGYTWSGAAPGLAVRADREKLQQILLNLLGNAVKFTQARDGVPGRIEVACSVDVGSGEDSGDAPGRRVRIQVRDTGEGIATAELERVFQPFVQADQRLTRPHAGVGLGLAISRDLARGMGGDLTVESAPGVGSTFTLSLPSVT